MASKRPDFTSQNNCFITHTVSVICFVEGKGVNLPQLKVSFTVYDLRLKFQVYLNMKKPNH